MSWEAIGALEYKKDKDPFPTKPNLHRGYPKALFWILEGINRVSERSEERFDTNLNGHLVIGKGESKKDEKCRQVALHLTSRIGAHFVRQNPLY